MAGSQIQFLKQIITKPIFILRKDFNQNMKSGRQATNISQDIPDVYIMDIQEESIAMKNGSKQTVHRIFVDINEESARNNRNKVHFSRSSTTYNHVGWILNEDLEICMLCKTSFSMFKTKHHCKACGNLVCQTCADQFVNIDEIQDLGPLRVCMMCDYGQVSFVLLYV